MHDIESGNSPFQVILFIKFSLLSFHSAKRWNRHSSATSVTVVKTVAAMFGTSYIMKRLYAIDAMNELTKEFSIELGYTSVVIPFFSQG